MIWVSTCKKLNIGILRRAAFESAVKTITWFRRVKTAHVRRRRTAEGDPHRKAVATFRRRATGADPHRQGPRQCHAPPRIFWSSSVQFSHVVYAIAIALDGGSMTAGRKRRFTARKDCAGAGSPRQRTGNAPSTKTFFLQARPEDRWHKGSRPSGRACLRRALRAPPRDSDGFRRVHDPPPARRKRSSECGPG